MHALYPTLTFVILASLSCTVVGSIRSPTIARSIIEGKNAVIRMLKVRIHRRAQAHNAAQDEVEID
jgi:hypothetical protein